MTTQSKRLIQYLLGTTAVITIAVLVGLLTNFIPLLGHNLSSNVGAISIAVFTILATLPALIAAIVQAISKWLTSRHSASITITIDDKKITMENISAIDAQRLAEQFLSLHPEVSEKGVTSESPKITARIPRRRGKRPSK